LKIIQFKPTEWYFRNALRKTQTLDQAREIGLILVRELEIQRQNLRDLGVKPKKTYILEAEALDKGIEYEA